MKSLGTLDLRTKVTCFCKKANKFFNFNMSRLNYFVKGGQFDSAIPISKSSLLSQLGARKLTGENLKVARAQFSTIS
jgi:hypothetical protein